jgi:hypothetical protein
MPGLAGLGSELGGKCPGLAIRAVSLSPILRPGGAFLLVGLWASIPARPGAP